MNFVSEFKNKELAFLHYERDEKYLPKRGYTITNSVNLEELEKILKINGKQYNSYVTIANYADMPRFPLNPKTHWPQYKQWVKERDQTITSIDFMLDFDTTSTIQGIKKAWADVTKAKYVLKILLGDQAKYLRVYFSGNKGFHILGKCKVVTTAQAIIDKQKDMAIQMSLICPSIDTSIYDTARLRKLLGSYVYSKTFGKTRVIPISNEQEFKELIRALKHNNQDYFENKELERINNITL